MESTPQTDFRALCAELAERLQWYINEDDTNEGDPGNAYWIEGKHRALDALTRVRAALAEEYEVEANNPPEGHPDPEPFQVILRAKAAVLRAALAERLGGAA